MTSPTASLAVESLSGALGAIVSGIDLAAGVDDALFADIEKAFLSHQVLFFRDQNLTPESYLAFARRFGPPADYPFAKGIASHPEITEIIKEADQTSNFGGIWHTDTSYLPEPPKATLLYAVETPAAGGDTLFANLYLAYDTLSGGMAKMLEGLRAVNKSALHGVALRGAHLSTGSMEAKKSSSETLSAEHPAIRTHPQTGRKALYVNPAHTAQFSGMTRDESLPILTFLYDHAIQPEFTCRFRWQPGSLAIWDNRCTLHCAINDYDGHRRVMQRITLQGDKPV